MCVFTINRKNTKKCCLSTNNTKTNYAGVPNVTI